MRFTWNPSVSFVVDERCHWKHFQRHSVHFFPFFHFFPPQNHTPLEGNFLYLDQVVVRSVQFAVQFDDQAPEEGRELAARFRVFRRRFDGVARGRRLFLPQKAQSTKHKALEWWRGSETVKSVREGLPTLRSSKRRPSTRNSHILKRIQQGNIFRNEKSLSNFLDVLGWRRRREFSVAYG